MMKKTGMNLLLAATLAGSALNASAQKMITFESREVNPHSRSQTSNGRNSLTLGLATWINGYTPLYYERAVAGIFSVQVGVGFTSRSYMNDLGMAIWNDGQDNSDRFHGSDDIPDHYEYYKFRKAQVGTYFSIAPKIYFDVDEVMDGVCVFPMFEYKSYRYQAQKADESQIAEGYYYSYDDERTIPHVAGTVNEHMNCMDFTMNFGGHFQSRSHLALDWSIGAGVRQISSQRLDLGEQPDAVNENYYYANNVVSYHKARPLFTFGLTLGGWF